jgi:hypothetical protein
MGVGKFTFLFTGLCTQVTVPEKSHAHLDLISMRTAWTLSCYNGMRIWHWVGISCVIGSQIVRARRPTVIASLQRWFLTISPLLNKPFSISRGSPHFLLLWICTKRAPGFKQQNAAEMTFLHFPN